MNTNEILGLIGRNQPLFKKDIASLSQEMDALVREGSFLVIGGGGAIGQSVTKEIFRRHPRKLHVVDLNENSLVELVRDIRSSFGYISGDFQTFAIDVDSLEYDAFIRKNSGYDYVLNLSALKHVRSEKDPFTLMRMINVNILNTIKTIHQSKLGGVKKYFCVSTDKAANPVNMMGASKRIMEMFLMCEKNELDISTARFANVAFSDGSLLYGFNQRIQKRQPIVAPSDIKRYFLTPAESGELCLLSTLLGDNGDIFFPKLNDDLHLISFSSIAERYLHSLGYEPVLCNSEEEARDRVEQLISNRKWPCLFSTSDTTGEKSYEEFFMEGENLDLEKFVSVGIVKNNIIQQDDNLSYFLAEINQMKQRGAWDKTEIVQLFKYMIPAFDHMETGKYLDSKM